MECDIQFTRDGVPVVIHDDHLKRLCDLDLYVSQLDLIDLKELCRPCFKLLTLHKLMAWLSQHPQLTLFVEIKPDILSRLVAGEVVKRLLEQIPANAWPQVVLISQAGTVLDACHSLLKGKAGWVAEGDDTPATPFDYIFMPYVQSSEIEQWHTRGVKVALYTINEARLAKEMLDLGADMIETDHFSKLTRELKKQV